MVTALWFFIQSIISTIYRREKAAVSLNAEDLSRTKKQEALSDPQHRFCPLFRLQWMVALWCGASSSFAEKWPQLQTLTFRENAAASLNQYFGMCNRFCQELRDNTAVYVVSPQWSSPRRAMIPLPFNNSLIAISWIALLPITIRMLHPSMQQSCPLQQYPNASSKSKRKFSRKENFQISPSLNQFVSHLVQRRCFISNLATRTNGIYIRKSKTLKIYQINFIWEIRKKL